MTPRLSRRRLLQAVAAAAVVLPIVEPGSAYAGGDIQRDTLDALARFKAARALPTWEEAFEHLLKEAGEEGV